MSYAPLRTAFRRVTAQVWTIRILQARCSSSFFIASVSRRFSATVIPKIGAHVSFPEKKASHRA